MKRTGITSGLAAALVAMTLSLGGCATDSSGHQYLTNTGKGALIGAAGGTAIGALTGGGTGAAIGAAGGAIAGGLIGSQVK